MKNAIKKLSYFTANVMLFLVSLLTAFTLKLKLTKSRLEVETPNGFFMISEVKFGIGEPDKPHPPDIKWALSLILLLLHSSPKEYTLKYWLPYE